MIVNWKMITTYPRKRRCTAKNIPFLRFILSQFASLVLQHRPSYGATGSTDASEYWRRVLKTQTSTDAVDAPVTIIHDQYTADWRPAVYCCLVCIVKGGGYTTSLIDRARTTFPRARGNLKMNFHPRQIAHRGSDARFDVDGNLP